MEKKRSSRNPQQIEKSQLNCMWDSSLYFGQNHRKQKLLSNGKAATKNVIGKSPRKLDALTYFNDQLYDFKDGAEVEALGVRTCGDMQKNTQIIARNEQCKEVDYGLFDHMISKYKPSSKKTCKNQSPLYDWKDTETGDFQQASGSAEISINKLKLASILEAICSQIHQENGDSQRSAFKNDQLDEISLQVLQTSAKAFIDQMFIDRKYISKGSASYEREQFSNALEMLNSNGDLFLKLLQDPNSLLAKQIRNMQNVQMARDSIKCFMSEQKHHVSASEESSSYRPSNKIVVLKPIPRTVRCSENVSCHCSSMQSLHSTSSKGENVKHKKFSLKDIKRKLKYAVGEKWKEKHLISVGSTLHKLHSISNSQNLEVGNEGGSSCLSIGRSVNSFTESTTKNEAPKVTFLTEKVRKKLDVSAISYTKKRELDISMEAKRHLSQRLNYVNTTGEAVMSRQPSRTLERILSSPEHDRLFNYSSKQDRKSNPEQMRHNDTNIEELPPQTAVTGFQSPQRHKDCQHLNSLMVASPSEVWSPGSSTDVSSSSPYSIYKLRGDHPSPVSVLEPVFTDDPTSPSRNQPSDTVLQPRRINFDRCLNKEFPENPILNHAEPVALGTYIQSSLHTLHLNWEELWVNRHLSEQMLDATLSDELETLALQCHSEPKLLMDYTNEVLIEAYDFHFKFPPWLSFVQPKIWSFPLEKHLVEKVMKEVRQHLIPVMEQSTLNDHVENDLAKSCSWLDIRNDAEDIVTHVTDDVLEESILDIVLQLHTSFLCSL
ncbi:hypothetical protein K7X08_013257 [Anisodus acutangulus]|uniref:DUF4378 domain-containing protein n=1 Tax=Anisodus acutangulus TaxID=402998 RepID=A0A9Q1MAP7_9SOLA|nr:hypothetical protein K7X08_013257 [Anisodus acutangulus]